MLSTSLSCHSLKSWLPIMYLTKIQKSYNQLEKESFLKETWNRSMCKERDTITGKQQSLNTKLLWIRCCERHWLEEDDSKKRDYEPYAACRRQVGWLARESNKQRKWGLDTSQETIPDFFFCWRCWCSEVSQYTTMGLFTAMTLDWDWSRDTALKQPSSSLDHTNKIPHCFIVLVGERGDTWGNPTVKTLFQNNKRQGDPLKTIYF